MLLFQVKEVIENLRDITWPHTTVNGSLKISQRSLCNLCSSAQIINHLQELIQILNNIDPLLPVYPGAVGNGKCLGHRANQVLD